MQLIGIAMFNATTEVEEGERVSYRFGVMTPAQYHVLLQVAQGPWMILAASGVIFNCLNLATFIRMGLKDCVTVSFCFQSVYDLCTLIVRSVHLLSILLRILIVDYGIYYRLDPFVVTIMCTQLRSWFYTPSVLTTTFLAIARCLCVYKPLKFKTILSTKRTYWVLFSFLVFASIIHGFRYGGMEIKERFSSFYNRTQLMLVLTSSFQDRNNVEDIIGQSFVTFSTFVIVLFSVFIMKRSLQLSAQFRLQSTARGIEEDAGQKSASLGGKELQALRQVYVVCLIFVVCNTPRIIIFACAALIPGFQLEGLYQYTLMACYCLRLTSENVSMSVNIFVYYKFNTNFRRILKQTLFSKKTK